MKALTDESEVYLDWSLVAVALLAVASANASVFACGKSAQVALALISVLLVLFVALDVVKSLTYRATIRQAHRLIEHQRQELECDE